MRVRPLTQGRRSRGSRARYEIANGRDVLEAAQPIEPWLRRYAIREARQALERNRTLVLRADPGEQVLLGDYPDSVVLERLPVALVDADRRNRSSRPGQRLVARGRSAVPSPNTRPLIPSEAAVATISTSSNDRCGTASRAFSRSSGSG